MRHLQFRALAAEHREILAPVKLKRLARLEDQRHKSSAPRRLLLPLPICPPNPGKGGNIYWTAETFPTLEAAQAATTDAAVAVEIEGMSWLLTLGPEDKVGHGGRWMASIGPIDRFDAPSYLLRVNISDAPTGTETSVHSHPGSEAMYVMSGEVTVNWPDKTSVIKAGEGSPGQPPHTPMLAASTGNNTLKELIMFVVDPSQDFARPEKMD